MAGLLWAALYLMKLRIIGHLIFCILILASCRSVSNEVYSQTTKDDKILYQNEKSGLYPKEPLNILKNNKKVAVIELEDKNVTYDKGILIIKFLDGTSFRLWRYYDYRGIDKITQSKDEDVVRIYHWESFFAGLFKRKDYITEFNINSKSNNTFRLKK